MKIRKPDDLLDKYLAAESTLEEEETLFDSTNTPPEIDKWSTYVKQKKIKAPPRLKDTIWEAIRTRKRKRQRRLASLSGVAASIALFIIFFMYTTDDKNKGYDEKEAILNEALGMFSDEKQMPEKQSVLYEDDLVVVYVTAQ